MYNQDYDDEGHPPAEWTRFRKEVKALDGCLFVTPEYNRSFPPVLKNALDIASRPYGQNLWSGKPGAVIGVSPGKLGAFGAGNQLRQTMAFLNIFLMQQPEAYIGEAASLFDEQGKLTNQGTADFLRQYADAFAAWALRFRE
jgi:chromate reductase